LLSKKLKKDINLSDLTINKLYKQLKKSHRKLFRDEAIIFIMTLYDY